MGERVADDRAGPPGEIRLWPFGTRLALAAVPLVAIVLLAAYAVVRAAAGWPGPRSETAVLLGIVLFSLLPLALVVVDLVAARGGTIGVRGVVIDFGGQLGQRSELRMPANMGVAGVVVPDSPSREIVDGLRAAAQSDIAVVDLEDGSAWWETRLLTLAAGAARLGRPRVIVFTATDHTRPQQFQGWAPAEVVVRRLLDADPRYRRAYRTARAAAQEWLPVPPPPPGAVASAPPALSGTAASSWIAFTPEGEPNDFAQEQFLAAELGEEAEPPERGIGLLRLRELLGPVLHDDVIDVAWPDGRRVEAALASDAAYAAVTDHGRYLGLVSRQAAHNAILAALVEQRPSGR